jgi:hypothetical protein
MHSTRRLLYSGVTTPSQVVAWIGEKQIRALIVAGNRESVSPEIGQRAVRFLAAAFRVLNRERG